MASLVVVKWFRCSDISFTQPFVFRKQIIDKGMNRLTLICGVIAVYIFIMLSLLYAQRKAKRINDLNFKELKKEVPYGILLRGILSIPVYFCLVDWVGNLNLVSWSYLRLPYWINLIGLVLLLLVVLFFCWIQVTLGENYHGPLHLHKNHRLITTGPFSFMRHPTYIANRRHNKKRYPCKDQ